ncbi:MAG: AzlC family ABC transporter permease [Acutalibacteraceae bacterium]|nr:AzlC family ABC transporter permease [Clostridia bacterium]MEE3449956.1 AzlC family ABC transporter permease [Acutalibacteraceae bacterium]
MKNKSKFIKGAADGIPIGLGYLSVSFGFGIMAVGAGLSPYEAFVISLTNLTSAGQAQGVSVIAAGGTLAEMALVQLVINIRYALMALSLSQKLDKRFTPIHRFFAAYGITDEIFAVCSSKKEPITPSYMYGVIAVSAFGWTLGTFLGAIAGELLPPSVSSALGIVLYGMFIAIVVPAAKKQKSILTVSVIAALLGIMCKYLLPFISGGFAVIICAVAASVIGAVLFPRKEEKP